MKRLLLTKGETVRIHEAAYIITSDGILGIVVGGTENFVDIEMDLPYKKAKWRFSLISRNQRNSQNRSFRFLTGDEVNSLSQTERPQP